MVSSRAFGCRPRTFAAAREVKAKVFCPLACVQDCALLQSKGLLLLERGRNAQKALPQDSGTSTPKKSPNLYHKPHTEKEAIEVFSYPPHPRPPWERGKSTERLTLW